VRRLADYFQVGGHGFEYFPYGEALDAGEFCDGTRAAYFTGIPDSALASALVFLDPDNGIEPGAPTGRNSHKYVKLSELKSLYDRMDRKSVLAVYQHLPRIHRRVFLYNTMRSGGSSRL
jgi:hypothetical protein